MELKEFIANVLTDILEGVENAKPAYVKSGGILPASHVAHVYGNKNYVTLSSSQADPILNKLLLTDVEFDITVGEISTNGKSKGIGVLLNLISIDGKSTSEKQIETASRIKFSVPLVFP